MLGGGGCWRSPWLTGAAGARVLGVVEPGLDANAFGKTGEVFLNVQGELCSDIPS